MVGALGPGPLPPLNPALYVTHIPKCNEPAKTQGNYNCGLTILIVFLFSLCRLRNTTQLRSGTVDKSKWPVFLQNASGNPSLETRFWSLGLEGLRSRLGLEGFRSRYRALRLETLHGLFFMKFYMELLKKRF